MTMPEPLIQEATDDEAIEIPPMPVYVVSKPGRRQPPEFGGAETISVPTAAQGLGYVQLIGFRPSRFEARIRNLDAANAVIIAETIAKVQAGIGYTLPSGQSEKWRSQQACYAIALTAAVNLSVIDESYDIPDDES